MRIRELHIALTASGASAGATVRIVGMLSVAVVTALLGALIMLLLWWTLRAEDRSKRLERLIKAVRPRARK